MTRNEPRHRSIVASSSGARVIVVADGGAWRLPTHPFTDAAEINAELSARLGMDVTTTGCVRMFGDVRNDDTPRVFGHWQRGAGASPRPGVRWIDRGQAEALPFAADEDRETVLAWFADRARGTIPLGGLPWAHDGWFAEAADWSLAQLSALGYQVTAPVEQLFARPWSCVLRLATSAGWVYFKAVVPGFGHEPRLTEMLARWFPGEMPQVLAVDQARHWMLTRDFGPFTEAVPTAERFEEFARVIVRYARMQQFAADHVDELIATGCPDHRLSATPALFDELLADTGSLLIGEDGGVTEEEYDQLRDFGRELPGLCARLAAHNLPETLQNVDFWHGNLAFTSDGVVYYDWSESVVSHPLSSLRVFLFCTRLHNPESTHLRQRLLNTYLACWERYATPEQLREAYRLAQPMGFIARASCWRATLARVEPSRSFRMAFTIPHNMKLIADWARSSATRSVHELV